MTDPNRPSSPDNWDELVKAAVARELDARSRRGRSALRTTAVATFAFGMGALVATIALTVQERPPKSPILASGTLAPSAIEAAAKPVQAPQAAKVASDSTSEDEPVRAAAVEPDDARPVRQIRDVTVKPDVDPSALPQDRSLVARSVTDPAPEVQQAGEDAAPKSDLEAWVAARRDARMVPRPGVGPSQDAPTEEAPAAEAPPELGVATSDRASARVKFAVSMRSGPDRGTAAVGVVPADASVQVMSCDGWCEVIYNGQRGFIYMTFLDSAPQRTGDGR